MSTGIKRALLAVFGALLALSVAVFGLSLKMEEGYATEAAYGITAENVTFKMGGAYGESVYYDFNGNWTDAGYIRSKNATDGNIEIYYDVVSETRTAGSLYGALRFIRADDTSAKGTHLGIYGIIANGTANTLHDTYSTTSKVKSLRYDAVNHAASVYVNGSGTVVALPNCYSDNSELKNSGVSYENADKLGAKYFGLAWNGGTYQMQVKLQIFDGENNDLGVAWCAANGTASSTLTGKVGETIYFTPATVGTPTVTTAGGESIAVAAGENGVYSFVMPEEAVTVIVEQITEAGITADNVTFKMGGAYGESVYYDLDAAWTNDGGAGWIVNATPTTGDVNMKLVMSEENVTGTGKGSLFGMVRLPKLNGNWATSFGFYNYVTNGANNSFIVGNWVNHSEFLVAYDSSVPSGTIYVGTSEIPVTSTLFTGNGASDYTGAVTWEYFGYGWANRGYSVKTKIQIYDENNDDLGVTTHTEDRTSYSCNLTGKVGETIYFTPATAGTPTVTTAGGKSIAVAAGENGVYSFVMPEEAVTVAAAPVVKKNVTFNKNGEIINSAEIEWNEENFVAAIPSVSDKDTQVIGYEYEGKLYKTGAAVFAAIGTPAEEITVNIVALHLETVDGAEVRASGTAGLRYTSSIGKSDYVTAYGMILTVKTNVDNSGENDGVGLDNFTKEKLDGVGYKYLETNSSEEGFNSYEKDGNVIFSLVITNIRDNHRELQYIARTFVTVTYEGGETVTYYSEVDFENNARSAHDVATSAIENKDINGLTEEQITFLEENYLKKA